MRTRSRCARAANGDAARQRGEVRQAELVRGALRAHAARPRCQLPTMLLRGRRSNRERKKQNIRMSIVPEEALHQSPKRASHLSRSVRQMSPVRGKPAPCASVAHITLVIARTMAAISSAVHISSAKALRPKVAKRAVVAKAAVRADANNEVRRVPTPLVGFFPPRPALSSSRERPR